MSPRRTTLLGMIILFLSSLACNAFAPVPAEPGANLPPPAITEEGGGAETPATVDGIAPTPTLPGETAVANQDGAPFVRIIVDLNVRTGPGVQYDRVGFVLGGETATVIGYDPLSGWWKIACPSRITEQTQCWVSGGAQYTEISDRAGVPVAEAPPTPTPRPTNTPEPDISDTTVANNGALLVYGDSDGIWLAGIDLSVTPPSIAEATQLLADPTIRGVYLSPNGQQIAYLAGTSATSRLGVIDVNGENGRILVDSSVLDDDLGDDLAASITNVTWLNNSQQLIFNTNVISLVGPGTASQADLWGVNLNGTVTEIYAPGTFAGTFDVAGDRLVGGQGSGIALGALNGTPPTSVLTFPQINTASEYIYYPQPQWTTSGNAAFVAVPDEEPFTNPQFTLWQISPAGTVAELSSLSGNILFNPVVWNGNGSLVAFVTQAGGEPDRVVIAEGDGTAPDVLVSPPVTQLFSWSPGGQHLFFTGNDFLAIGQADGTVSTITGAGTAVSMQWLNNETFVAVTATASNSRNLVIGQRNGTVQVAQTFVNESVVFDIRTP